MALKLNLGCGREYDEEFKNIDISKDVKTDECYDINKGIKEKDNSVSEIRVGCVLEQVKDLVRVMNECWRVLEPGGLMTGYVPSTDPRVLHLDPHDIRFFQEDTFKYFVKDERNWQYFGKNYGYYPWSKVETSINDNGILHFKIWK